MSASLDSESMAGRASVATEDGASPRQVFISPREMADAIGVSRGHIYTLMKSGVLKTLKLGGRRLIPASELDRFSDMAGFEDE